LPNPKSNPLKRIPFREIRIDHNPNSSGEKYRERIPARKRPTASVNPVEATREDDPMTIFLVLVV
jgi:hypothetical protein